LALAERLQAITVGPNPRTLDVLGAAYAAMGRFEEAVQTGEQASQLSSEMGHPDLAREIDQRVELYRSHRAYHSPAP
jgi:hypothetical protein